MLKSKAETKLAGLKIHITDTTSDIEIEFLRDILKYAIDEEHVTAIISENISLWSKVQSILMAMGKQIGRDVSVISVEQVEGQGAQMLPKIDCYYVPARMMGEAIATELLDELIGKKNGEQSKKFMPEYKERGSVRTIEDA